MYRTLVLPALLLIFAYPFPPQQPTPKAQEQAPETPSYDAIPISVAKTPNPVQSTPESLARAKKWWTMDCEMCHGKNGNGKGDTAKEMKLVMADFTNSDTLKGRTDGEIFYIIRNGHNDMPAEGKRVTAAETWDLVNYVRAFTKKSTDAKPQ